MAAEGVLVEWTITASGTEETSRGLDAWLIKEAPDGGREHHSFPLEALEWRAAEYGIDPTDTEALLDLIVHEPYVPDPADPANVLADAAVARGFVSPAVEPRRGVAPLELVPTTLWNAETIALARGAHLERIAAVKTGRATVSRPHGKGKLDPLQPLLDAWAAFADAGEVADKQARVAEKRRHMQTAARERAERGETGTRKRIPKDTIREKL